MPENDSEKPSVSIEVYHCHVDLVPFHERLEFAIAGTGMNQTMTNKLETIKVIYIYQLQGETRERIGALGNVGVVRMRQLDTALARAGVQLTKDGDLKDLWENNGAGGET